MKIVLLQSVRGLGDPGDIVNVKSGYARNYLIPQDMAIYATKNNITQIEKRIEKAKEIEAARIEKLKVVAEKLNKLSLKFELKVNTPLNKIITSKKKGKAKDLCIFALISLVE